MVSAVIGSWFVPPERWMVEIKPAPETFGSVVRQHRLARGWSQREVARRTGIDQTEISKFERDAYRYRKEDVIVAFEEAFGLTRGELAHLPWGDATRDIPDVPGLSVAIPAEPELIEAVRALFLLEADELGTWAEAIRLRVKTEQQKSERPERGLAAS